MTAAQHAPAQGTGPHADPKATPGIWRAQVRTGSRTASPAEHAFTTQLDDIAASVHALAFLNPPVGFSVEPHVALLGRDSRTRMLTGEYILYIIPHTIRPDGSVDIAPPGHGFEGLQFSIAANATACILGESSAVQYSDVDGALYPAPVVGSYQGHPTFNDCVILTRRNVPPIVPATRERVLRILIRQNVELPVVMRALQTQLDVMSAADRAAPAFLDGGVLYRMQLGQAAGGNLFASAVGKAPDDALLQALVQPNPAFFDTTRPGDIQLLSIVTPCSARYRRQSQWCAGYGDLFDRLEGSLDWPVLTAIVRP